MSGDKDFLNSDFPMYAAGGVGLFVLYRAYVSNTQMEPLQPACMSQGVFPAVFFTAVGALACHEMLLDMMSYPGGLTAWAPAVLAVIVASFAAYRGQRAASGGELGMGGVTAIVALTVASVWWLIGDVPEEPLTKAQLKKAAKEAAKRAAKGIVAGPKMLGLEKNNDIVTEYMHIVLGLVVAVALVLGLVNGPGVWPRNLQEGAFPACFMVVTGVLAYNSFLRQARAMDGGGLDDFLPAFTVMLVASIAANRAAAIQKPT